MSRVKPILLDCQKLENEMIEKEHPETIEILAGPEEAPAFPLK